MKHVGRLSGLAAIALLVLAGGCEPQGQAQMNTSSGQGLSADMAKVQTDLAATRSELEQAQGRNYDLQQRIVSLNQQLAGFDKGGLLKKIAETERAGNELSNQLASLRRELDAAEHPAGGPDVAAAPYEPANKQENPLSVVDRILGPIGHGMSTPPRTYTPAPAPVVRKQNNNDNKKNNNNNKHNKNNNKKKKNNNNNKGNAMRNILQKINAQQNNQPKK